VQGLPVRELARGEFAEELDVVGRRERLEHRSHLFCTARAGQLTVVVGERVVDRVQPSASCGRVERAGLRDVAPEDERMSVPAVWARRKQIARRDDRCAPPSRVPSDSELPLDVGRIDARSTAGHPRDHRRGPQVHEHVPSFAQDDRLLAVHPVGIGDCDRRLDCTHAASVDRPSPEGVTPRADEPSSAAALAGTARPSRTPASSRKSPPPRSRRSAPRAPRPGSALPGPSANRPSGSRTALPPRPRRRARSTGKRGRSPRAWFVSAW
jgi:hypothetical protein